MTRKPQAKRVRMITDVDYEGMGTCIGATLYIDGKPALSLSALGADHNDDAATAITVLKTVAFVLAESRKGRK